MRVLVIEDYGPIRESVAQGLREAGFAVDAAPDGSEGLWYAETNDYDVILLDLMLPKLSGLEVLAKLRAGTRRARVLILTAKDEIEDRVAGLNLGADDYMIKPFDFDELLARVRTLVRRRYDLHASVIRVGDLVIDMSTRTVRRGEKVIELTAREYSLIEYLAVRAGELVSRSDIWEHVYEFNSESQSNVVDVYIGYLRKKVEADGLPKLIHTRRGQGYWLGESS